MTISRREFVKLETTEYLAPAINFCLDEFGPDRVEFGGNWPACKLGASYAEWVTGLKHVIAARPLADQKKLLHDNAVKHYRLAALNSSN